MSKPSERSRAESPSQGRGKAASGTSERASYRTPKDKKHKSLAEVQQSGRQSDQGGSPGAGSSRRSATRSR